MLNHQTTCRHCDTPLQLGIANLGHKPLANSYLPIGVAAGQIPTYPLQIGICPQCLLVQLTDTLPPAVLFTDYAYCSSTSESWLQRARHFATDMQALCSLNDHSFVVEIGSNDGYLLQYFTAMGISVLGIDPAANLAASAAARGVTTEVDFFSSRLAQQLAAERQADLIIANNVIAHTPDINDVLLGLKTLLAPNGKISLEFPHCLNLIQQCQFDTIYHEHVFYYSLLTLTTLLDTVGLKVVDVERITSHGGSLRVMVMHCGSHAGSPTAAVASLLQQERDCGLDAVATYLQFPGKIKKLTQNIQQFFSQAGRQGKVVAGYGAPAKSSTLLCECGINKSLLPFTVDKNPLKQGCLIPGTDIPIYAPAQLHAVRPDYIVIFPWNIQQEIIKQVDTLPSLNTKWVVPVPELTILN